MGDQVGAGASELDSGSAAAGQTWRSRRVWSGRRAVLCHVVLVLWCVGCIVACRWQISVGESGDVLGWVYSVMWPCFALFGVVFWWYLLHDDPETVGKRALRRLDRGPHEAAEIERRARSDELIRLAEEDDPELAAYNAYLSRLARGGTNRKR